MKKIMDITDLDVIYLTYDEPQKEIFWLKIQDMVPWAKRVDGVKGSDAAHKAAAENSDTDRFILIDGDNMPYPEFFSEQLVLTDDNHDCVFRWKARNNVNGLMYGNGGISCWTKDFALNMKTHENSDGSPDTAIEFCFDPKYVAMYNVYSDTIINQSPYQAWRAGFREGVKMCLNKGVRPSLEEFESMVHKRNLDNLIIWMNIGEDITYGDHVMSGARCGVYLTMLTDWDYTEVHDFDKIKAIWSKWAGAAFSNQLETRLGLPLLFMNGDQSAFFKKYGTKHKNRGIMTTEMEVIREEEGW